MRIPSFHTLVRAFFMAILAVTLSGCKAPPALAANDYGLKIVAPEREDTPQHPDLMLGPAIQDLQTSLQKMTGHQYTVARGEAQYKGDGIYLVLTSSPKAPADAVAKLKGKGREPFIIRAKDAKNLWIIANNEAGLQHGIYFYLDQLGARWFLPNENWTIIPKRDSVALKVDRLVAPAFKSRDFFGTGGYGPTAPYDSKYDEVGRLQFRIREEDWTRRNGFGGEFILDGHAGEDFNLQNKDFLIAHPDYLASVDGKSVWSETAQLNPTNPDAVKMWTDYSLKKYRAVRASNPDSPHAFAVSVDPADGGGFCNSAECRAMFQAKGESEQTFYSNQVFYVANQVAKAVRQEFPDGYVNLYAYANHSAPPSLPLEPNVYVTIIPYGFNYSGLPPKEFIAAWSKKTTRLSIYDYWSIPDWTWDQPSFNYLTAPKDKLSYWHDHNVEGFNIESTFSAGAMGVAWYLTSHLMWDLNADQDAVLADFYDKSFGPAAPPMKRMLERWAKTFLLSSQELSASFRDLEQAETLAGGDAAIEARIDDFAKYVQYLRLYAEYSNATDKAKKLEANKKLVEHLFDIYDSNMVGSFRIFQFLTDYNRNKEVANEFNMEDPDAPGWKRTAPLSHADVAALIAQGVQDYQPLDFEPKSYGEKLVPLTPSANIAAPAAENAWTPRMGTRGGMAVEVLIPANRKTLPLRVSLYYDNTVTVEGASGKEIFRGQIKGVKGNEQGEELEIPFASPGLYTIRFDPGNSGGLWFQTASNVPLAMRIFRPQLGMPSPRLYFYVPRGLKTIAFWLVNGDLDGNYPQIVKNPDGERVPIESHDGTKLVTVKVPAGQDGKIWSLESVRSPNEPIRMINVPQSFSFSPETLMVPQDALPNQ